MEFIGGRLQQFGFGAYQGRGRKCGLWVVNMDGEEWGDGKQRMVDGAE